MSDDHLMMRRAMDQELADNQRLDRARLDAMLAKMAALEAALNHLQGAYDQQHRQTLSVQEQQTEIIQKLTEFSARFVDHIEDEAAERAVLKAIAETITVHSERISLHSERISALDRLVWASIGACGLGAAGAVGWALNHVASSIR